MPISVDCLQCGEPHNVPDEAAGRRIRCKGYGEPVSVPSKRSRSRPQRQRQQRDEIEDYDDDDDDDFGDDGYDEFDEPAPRRRSTGGSRGRSQRSQSKPKSGGGFRWGPLVALIGIPLLLLGLYFGGDNRILVGGALMNIAFGVSASISTVQKGHPIGLAIPLGFLGLIGLLVVSFLSDNTVAPAKKGKKKRRR